MNEISRRIFELLELNNLTAYQMSKGTGISQGTISAWKVGKSAPKPEFLAKIAEYLNVPVGYFLEDIKKAPSEEDAALIARRSKINAMFDKLSPKEQEKALEYAEMLYALQGDREDQG